MANVAVNQASNMSDGLNKKSVARNSAPTPSLEDLNQASKTAFKFAQKNRLEGIAFDIEESLAALLRAHKNGVPLAIFFVSPLGKFGNCLSEVRGMFHCKRCSEFWKRTQKVLRICYEMTGQTKSLLQHYAGVAVVVSTRAPSYIDEPCIPITISDATTLVTILEWSNIFATNELINIFPLLKKTNHEDRESLLCSLNMAGDANQNNINYFVFVGGEMSPDGRVFPFGKHMGEGEFEEGGPPIGYKLRKFDGMLYRRRAEEEYSRAYGITFSQSMNERNDGRDNADSLYYSYHYDATDNALLGKRARSCGQISNHAKLSSSDLLMKEHVSFSHSKKGGSAGILANDVCNRLRGHHENNGEKSQHPTIAMIKRHKGVIRTGTGAFSSFRYPQFFRSDPTNHSVWNKAGTPRTMRLPNTIRSKKAGLCNTKASFPGQLVLQHANEELVRKQLEFQDIVLRRRKNIGRRLDMLYVEQLKKLFPDLFNGNLSLSAAALAAILRLKASDLLNSTEGEPFDFAGQTNSFCQDTGSRTGTLYRNLIQSIEDFAKSLSSDFSDNAWRDNLSINRNSMALLRMIISQSSESFEGLSLSRKLAPRVSPQLESLLQSQKFTSRDSSELESLLRSQKFTSQDLAELESLVQSLRKLASLKTLRSANSYDLADLLSFQKINSMSSSGSGHLGLGEASSSYNTRSKNSLSWMNSYSSSFERLRALGHSKDPSKLDSSESLQKNLQIHDVIKRRSNRFMMTDVAAGNPQHFRKSSLQSDFSPKSNVITSLDFTESFKFSYFNIPKHVRDHNHNNKNGNLWYPLSDILKKPPTVAEH